MSSIVRPRKPSRRLCWLPLAVVLAAALLSCGCTWQSKNTAYRLGPVFSRIGGIESNVCETVWFPCNLTLGRQCNFSLGLQKQVVALGQPAESGGWRLRLRQQLPLADVPVFCRDQFLGARLQGGTAQNGLTVGYASGVLIRPDADGIYQISFDSNRPMAAEVQFWREVPADFAAIISDQKIKP